MAMLFHPNANARLDTYTSCSLTATAYVMYANAGCMGVKQKLQASSFPVC